MDPREVSMMALRDAIRSDIQGYVGGVTWVDVEDDERPEAVCEIGHAPIPRKKAD